MKYFLLLTLITAQAQAGFWCPEKPSELRSPRPNAGCFEVADDFDPEVAKVKNGKLEIDPDKAAAKAQKEADREAARQDKLAKVQACEALYDNVGQANTNAEIKAILKCLVKDAR